LNHFARGNGIPCLFLRRGFPRDAEEKNISAAMENQQNPATMRRNANQRALKSTDADPQESVRTVRLLFTKSAIFSIIRCVFGETNIPKTSKPRSKKQRPWLKQKKQRRKVQRRKRPAVRRSSRRTPEPGRPAMGRLAAGGDGMSDGASIGG
jgi:hypothetical protein